MSQKQMIPIILQFFLIVVNIISLVAFGVDKLNSKRRSYRIPESRLLLLAFVAPFGALAGMLLFRHKTRKAKFLLVPVFVLPQLIVLAWYFFPNLLFF
jgi:uncharacterized membrane protein YsdA (DUF1294 family)